MRPHSGSISFTVNSKATALTTKEFSHSFSKAFSAAPSVAFSMPYLIQPSKVLASIPLTQLNGQ